MESFSDKINSTIGKVIIGTSVTNSFPLVGEEVTLYSTTKWSQNIKFDIEKSNLSGDTIERLNTGQTESVKFEILGAGDLKQTVTSSNFLSTGFSEQYIYSLDKKNEPYFTIDLKSEISRTDEDNDIYIYPELGFELSGYTSILIKIYNENETTNEILTFNSISYDEILQRYHTGLFNINKRGYYDVEVDLTSNGTTFTKRINKLITITPRLSARPTQQQIDNNDYTLITVSSLYGIYLKMYETGENDLYCVFELKEGQTDNLSGWYPSLNLHYIPAGKSSYTFVLKKDYTYKEGVYFSRILLQGSTNVYESNENGTPQFSFDIPLVFTIDQDFPLEILGVSHATVNYNGCIRNTVWDGRGYFNLNKGIKFTSYSPNVFWEDGFMLLNGTSDIELFEIEISNTNFTAIMAKTDPNNNNPWFWKNNFSFNNFIWHHSYIHDTNGEGCYLGYYTSEQHTGSYTGPTTAFLDLSGNSVNYINGVSYNIRAHEMNKLRIFRNKWERTGYDGVQVSNATESEFCYNIVDYGAIRNESNQASGISLQSMDGLIYNNISTNSNGPSFQLGPYRDGFNMFNNICSTFKKVDAIQFLWSITSPDQNPSGGPDGSINNTTVINIYNNVLVSGRYTANGRNTVQLIKVFFYDNLMVNNGINFASMTTNTLSIWESQKKNNSIVLLSDFLNNLNTYKIADVYNNNYQISCDSPLINGGSGDSFIYDYRGYKNWIDGCYPIGPFLGKYKKSDISLISLIISQKPLDIINEYQCTFTYNPSHTTETGIIWSSTNENVATVDGNGLITVLSSGSTTIRITSVINPLIYDEFTTSCGISLDPLSTTRISFGNYDDSMIPIEGNKFENGTNIITYLNSGGTISIKDINANTIGTLIAIDKIDQLKLADDVYSTSGSIVPENGFTSAQMKAWTWYAGSLGYKTLNITGLTEGSYTISIFGSNNYTIRPANTGAYYQLIVNEGTYSLSGQNVSNNLNNWLSQELNIGSSGLQIIYGNNGGTNGYSKIPINAILIERMS